MKKFPSFRKVVKIHLYIGRRRIALLSFRFCYGTYCMSIRAKIKNIRQIDFSLPSRVEFFISHYIVGIQDGLTSTHKTRLYTLALLYTITSFLYSPRTNRRKKTITMRAVLPKSIQTPSFMFAVYDVLYYIYMLFSFCFQRTHLF